MSSGLNYAKAKTRVRLGAGEPRWYNTGRWRTEYPEEFPVTVTRKDRVDNEIREIDGNGFTPGEPECACCLRDDPAYQLGFSEGFETALLKYAITMLERAKADASGLREQLARVAGPHGAPTSTVGL